MIIIIIVIINIIDIITTVQNHHHHHQHHYLCQAVKSSVDSNPELLQTEHMSCHVIQSWITAY